MIAIQSKYNVKNLTFVWIIKNHDSVDGNSSRLVTYLHLLLIISLT